MDYYKIDPQKPDPKIISKAVQCLEKGGVLVYPTDTLYGLAIDPYNREAVYKLYMLKQRNMSKPVSIMLNSIHQIKEILGYMPSDQIKSDLEKLLPGKVTILLENKYQKEIPLFEDVTNPGAYRKKIGIRVPLHPVTEAITKTFGLPVTSTSANLSGRDNVFTIKDIIAQFSNQLDFILDAGPIPESKGSTVIDFSKEPYLIFREGDVSAKKIKEKIGPERVAVRKSEYVITFVCSGNICRSPMAEALLKKMLNKTKYKNSIKVQSAGILKLPNFPAHASAREVCKMNDISLDTHISQPISEKIMEESELVFCLAQNHYTFLNSNYPMHRKKIVLLKQFGKQDLLSIPSIADPIGHSLDFFKNTYKEIYTEVKRILPAILSDKKRFIKFNEL